MSVIQSVLETVERRNAGEQEFLQAVREVLESLDPVIERHPEYAEACILERSLLQRYQQHPEQKQ